MSVVVCGLLVLLGQPPAVELVAPAAVVDGDPPGLRVKGLAAGEVVRVHVARAMEKWAERDGRWQRGLLPLHAWAEFAAGPDGQIAVDTAAPRAGSYAAPDPLALLRTGFPLKDKALAGQPAFPAEGFRTAAGRVLVRLERNGAIAAEASFPLLPAAADVVYETVAVPGLNGVYARPPAGKDLPVVVALHGSEGGSADKARTTAGRFASRGFACLAVNYFAYPHETVPGVPARHENIPLETIPAARDWLAKRPEADAKRFALYGVSKGAEFALAAAARYDWVTAAVAVVPSDIVWQGYGDGIELKSDVSSWSAGGKPLPFVPLFPFDPKQEGLYRTNTERYDRSRLAHPEQATLARIPVEQTSARLLLLAADRDEVWASGAMARTVAERMTAAGKGDRVAVKIYPRAGHQIAGTGTYPVRVYGVQGADPDAKDIVAEGEAAADAWQRTVRFLAPPAGK